MKKMNYLLVSLIILIMSGCQKNELVDSTTDNDLPEALVQLQKDYGLTITENLGSRAESEEVLSLDEIKERLDIFKALCQDTIYLKSEFADTEVTLNASTRTIPQDQTYYARGEYITTPGQRDCPESYINVNVKLTTLFSLKRFTIELTSANSSYLWYQDLVDSSLTYNAYSGGYDFKGAIRLKYNYVSLETGNSYNVVGRYNIKGDISTQFNTMNYITFTYAYEW